MQLAIGSTLLAVNSCDVVDRRETLWNAGGQPYAQRKSFDVRGYLYGDGQAAITLAMSVLQTALGGSFPSVTLFQDSGAPSATLLTNVGSITGVRVTRGPSFPKNEGAEYATQRYFEFSAEAEYPLANTANLLLSYSERLSFSGGGPIYRFKLAVNGPPQKQLVYPQSVYRCVQSGEATGYLAYPVAAAPKFPAAWIDAPGKLTKRGPERKGKGYQGWPISWEYTFESVGPLAANPTLWVN